MIDRCLLRVRSERGSVGVLMAVFIMVAVGSLVMTWNTVQLSKEKMRMQAAADSAALSAAVWQARGMNAVQNINDDMYVSLSLASKLISIATPIQLVAIASWKMRFVPFVGPFFQAVAIASFGTAMLIGGTSAWMVNVCRFILCPLQIFYVKSSAALGFLGALQLAAKNGASRLISESSAVDEAGFSYGLFAIGAAARQKDLFVLPLKQAKKSELKEEADEDGSVIDKITDLVSAEPWYHLGGTSNWTKLSLVPSWVSGVHTILGTGSGWRFQPYVTPQKDGKNVLPSPVLFIVRRNADHVETIDMKWWDPDFQSRPAKAWPIMAVAAAQCITGDVIPHSKEPENNVPNPRPSGFGTGATARLIPIREYAKWAEEYERSSEVADKNVRAIEISKGIFH